MPDYVLIDSSAWVAALRVHGNQAMKLIVKDLVAADIASTCPVVIAELLQGARSADEYEELREAFDAFHSLPVLETDWYGAARMG